MIVKRIAAGELRSMEDSDGLILQNLKEDPEDCVDAVNALFATRHILKNGTKFHDCLAFDFEGKTCLLFPFMKDVELFPGKLAVWLNRTQRIYQGAWLTDFVDDHLGGFLNKPLSGTGRSAANLSFQFHTYPREERMSRQMPDTQNAWTGFDVPDNEVAGSLLWLAVFYDALKREPKDYAYDVICDSLKCTHYADKRGITKEKVVQEINAITERWLDQRFGVLRLGQNYSKPNSFPSEENKEANGNERN